MLGKLTFLTPPLRRRLSKLEEQLDICKLCVCVHLHVCMHTSTLPLAGHGQALSPLWTWGQGTAAAAFPLLGRAVLKTKQLLPLGLALPWGSWNTARREVPVFPPCWSFSATGWLVSSWLSPGSAANRAGGTQNTPSRLISPSHPVLLDQGQGDLSPLSIPGAAHWGHCSLLLSNTTFYLQHLFLQEVDAQTQRKASLFPQRQKFQEQWCILEFRKLSDSVSHPSEHLFPYIFLSIYLYLP